jgi:TatD DNase family protein
MIDMHTHLDLYPDALKVAEHASKLNEFTLAVTTSPRAWVATTKVFSNLSRIRVALGMHPEIVFEKQMEIDLLISSISKSKFIGEIGIDGATAHSGTLQMQEQTFDRALKECQNCGGRIISIHSRSATSRVLSALAKYPHCGIPILHWFSGTISELKQAIALGCFFSINPTMMQSKKGRELASKIPPELVLAESDGPFATRHGKPIMPWEATSICKDLSDIWKTSYAQAKEKIHENFFRIIAVGKE